MSSSIVYLHTRTSFKQVSDDIPITRQRNPDKFDPPDVFEGVLASPVWDVVNSSNIILLAANQRELVTDLIRKSKEIEFLIQSLPVPEPEEDQVSNVCETTICTFLNKNHAGAQIRATRDGNASCQRRVPHCVGKSKQVNVYLTWHPN